MSTKAKYYEIFGLTETATKPEVKRAYRKLAMKFHPDRNPDPKAHKLFVDLTDAYHILMDDKPAPQPQSSPNQPRSGKSEEQRIKEAQERLKQQSNRIKLQQEYYFRKMTSGPRWRIFRLTAFVASLLSLILLVEPFLPTHFENHTVTAYSSSYNGLEHRDIRYLKTEEGLGFFVSAPHEDIYHYNPEIVVERSFLMLNPIRIWYQSLAATKSYPVDFSIVNLYPLFPLFLLFPGFTLWYKRKAYYFVMLYYFSQYIIGAAVLYVLFSQDRWLHILTFGKF